MPNHDLAQWEREQDERQEEHIPEWMRYQAEQIQRAMKQVEYLEQERGPHVTTRGISDL